MSEKNIKILSDFIKKSKNATWREQKSFNEIIEHISLLEMNSNDKTIYLERICSWYVNHILELNSDHITEVSYEFFTDIILKKLKLILKIPSDYNYLSFENNVLGIDLSNKNKIQKHGVVRKAVKLFILDVMAYETKTDYETIQNRL